MNRPANSNEGVIVGAGPTGLAAALFLRRAGISTRIVEVSPQPAVTSRALAVNPRSLDILQHAGVADTFLHYGRPMTDVYFWRGRNVLAHVELKHLPHRHKFLLALSQASTEGLLENELKKLGGIVERGKRVSDCRQKNGKVVIDVGGETISTNWLLGADGAHSIVRKDQEIGFPGDAFPETWYLADVSLGDMPHTKNDTLSGHGWLRDEGGVIVYIPVITGPDGPRNLWRIISNFPEPLQNLPAGRMEGPPAWESDFHVSHRMASTLNVGNVYLAGDAAHIHSPIGARGMNLGMEDAFVFSELMRTGRINEYGAMRHKVDEGVVDRIRTLTTVMRGASPFTRALRRYMMPLVAKTPFLRPALLKMVTGLDHAIGV
ncbi:MAG: FAD-dependent oxidoreductase [Bdellovibrionales bacterium]